MSKAQYVALRPAIAALVLDELVGQLIGGPVIVPGLYGTPVCCAPATELLDVLQEMQEVGAGARHFRQGGIGVLPDGHVKGVIDLHGGNRAPDRLIEDVTATHPGFATILAHLGDILLREAGE